MLIRMISHFLLFIVEVFLILVSFPMAFRPPALNRSVFNPTLYKRVLDVWFDGLSPDAKGLIEAVMLKWLQGTPESKLAFDNVCRQEFGHALEAVNPKNYPILANESPFRLAAPFIEEIAQAADDTEQTSRTLSLILLFDQIPRHLYRTTETLPLVYNHYDRIALGIAQHMLNMTPRPDLHPSVRYSTVCRLWFYLPLLHSENLENHKTAMRIHDEMRAEALDLAKSDPSTKDSMFFVEKIEEADKIHFDLIQKFGQYPHRNKCLGRESTKEEREYLEAGGETFGVKG